MSYVCSIYVLCPEGSLVPRFPVEKKKKINCDHKKSTFKFRDNAGLSRTFFSYFQRRNESQTNAKSCKAFNFC